VPPFPVQRSRFRTNARTSRSAASGIALRRLSTTADSSPAPVVLAVTRGLNQELEEKDGGLKALEQDLSELRQTVRELADKKD